MSSHKLEEQPQVIVLELLEIFVPAGFHPMKTIE